ncbi:MAG: hypothetical protein Crog4KO_24570 [Crocinitomicaceae bacterium]
MLTLFSIWTFLHALFNPLSDDSFVQYSNERVYTIEVNTTVSYRGLGTVAVDLFLGTLQTNEYQKVLSSSIERAYEKQSFGFAGDSCVYYDIDLGPQTRRWRKELVQQSYSVTVHDIHVNFDLIDSIYPYQTNSDTYKAFTSSNLPFIDVENTELLQVSDSIWKESKNVLDYAKKCYIYVPKTYKYLDPISGFHSLDKILAKGGGDCGNLSSIYITLLRMKGIPARHLVGFRPDETLHAWADFYLENYGWVPVDVNYKQSDPEGNYFGNILFENNGFIIHRGIGYVVTRKAGPVRLASLQTVSYSDAYSVESPREVLVDRRVTAVLID